MKLFQKISLVLLTAGIAGIACTYVFVSKEEILYAIGSITMRTWRYIFDMIVVFSFFAFLCSGLWQKKMSLRILSFFCAIACIAIELPLFRCLNFYGRNEHLQFYEASPDGSYEIYRIRDTGELGTPFHIYQVDSGTSYTYYLKNGMFSYFRLGSYQSEEPSGRKKKQKELLIEWSENTVAFEGTVFKIR